MTLTIKWLPPIHDETFTSWVFRCSLTPRCRPFSEWRGTRYQEMCREVGDADFDFTSAAFFELETLTLQEFME